MERIICDSYVKGEKQIWNIDKDKPINQEFNRKILAVNDMYGWLYQNGILRNVSFQMKDYSDITYFAFDAKDLECYREAMAASGIPDADVALHHIFDEEYTPCVYSGAIELGWTMMGYRDVDGTVGRSWECGLLKNLSAEAALEIEQIRNREGVKEAVCAAFVLSDFEPSDITKDGAILTVMALSKEHKKEVSFMDDKSGNYLSQWIDDNEDYAWGVFAHDKLIGYCSIGLADDCCSDIEDFPGYTSDSLLLSDVFVDPRYRHLGCGSFLVDNAIKLRTKNDHQLVFLSLLHDGLQDFYKKLGFNMIGERHMVRDERSLGEIKFEEDFNRAFEFHSRNDESMLEYRDYLFSNGDKLISCYEQDIQLDLIDVDCWVRYEELLEDKLDHDEYHSLNAVLDGDPHDIEDNYMEAINFLRQALREHREQGGLSDSYPIYSLIEGEILWPEESADKMVVEKSDLNEQISAARSRTAKEDSSGSKPALEGPGSHELRF